MAKKTTDELRKQITDKIITALEKGVRPWVRPWTDDPNCGFPTNIISKKRYSGVNPFCLTIGALIRGFQSKWWGTYDQWQSLGGQVKKRPANVPAGQWGEQIVFYKIFDVDDKKKKKADGTPAKKKIFMLREYTVFNLDQVEGEKLDKYRSTTAPVDAPADVLLDWEPAAKLIKGTGAKIHYGGDRAFYCRPSPKDSWPKHSGGDYIQIPNKQQFTDQSEFFITHFHELAHWSEVRLDWTGSYEMGELIAEITACYLGAETKVPNRSMENHNRYLASWLKSMHDDPKWIFQASTQATKVADFLLNHAGESEESEPGDAEDGEELERAA